MKSFVFFSKSIPLAPPAGFTLVELMIVIAIGGILMSLGIPNFLEYRERARVQVAIAEIRLIEKEIVNYQIKNNELPESLSDAGMDDILDPWGRRYQYLRLQTDNSDDDKGNSGNGKGKGNGSGNGGSNLIGQARKDHSLVPLNSDFDLYSVGKDGKSQAPLTAKSSQDDVIRAHDGGFVGLGADY